MHTATEIKELLTKTANNFAEAVRLNSQAAENQGPEPDVPVRPPVTSTVPPSFFQGKSER